MKKFILPLIAMASVAFVGSAEQLTLGYVSPGIDLVGDNGAKRNDVWSSGAIFIPASTLRTCIGADITGINAGLQSKLHIDALKVWVRTSLDGENLAEQTVDGTTDPALKKGWNKVALSNPLKITEEIAADGLYIGYSVHQTGQSYGLSNNAVASEYGWFVNLDENGWEDKSDKGTLCVEAVVEGDALPATNLAITHLGIDNVLVIDRNKLKGRATVKNFGSSDVSGYDLSMIVDGDKVYTYRVDRAIPSGYVDTAEFILTPGLTDDGDYNMTYRIDAVPAGEDADPSDNEKVQPLKVIFKPLQRVALIEEFTTERCPNCPPATYTLNNFAHQEEYEGRLAIVCHHSAYYTDFLTTSFDEAYTAFYNSGSTYAPAMMVDRNANGSYTPVMGVSTSVLERAVKESLEDEPKLKLDLEVGKDPNQDNRLKVLVKGVKYTDVLCNTPAITVFLVEDNIKPQAQAGASASFIHNHVNRAVNSTWGELISFDDNNEFVYEHEFTVSADWKKEDLQVVAFVHNYNPSDYSDWNVANAAFVTAADFKDSPVGVGIVEAVDYSDAEYYTLNGIRVDASGLVPGIYVRRLGNRTEKIVIK